MEQNYFSEKAIQEIDDKNLPYLKNKGRRIGIIILVSTYLLIMAFTQFFGERYTGWAITSIAFAVYATDKLTLYHLTKKTEYLVLIIFSILTTIFSAIAYIFSIAL